MDNGEDMVAQEESTSPSISLCSDNMTEVEKCEVGDTYTLEVKAVSKNTHESIGRKNHSDVSFKIVSMKPTKKQYGKKVSEYGQD